MLKEQGDISSSWREGVGSKSTSFTEMRFRGRFAAGDRSRRLLDSFARLDLWGARPLLMLVAKPRSFR